LIAPRFTFKGVTEVTALLLSGARSLCRVVVHRVAMVAAVAMWSGRADASLNTLLHLRITRAHIAERGLHGEGSNRSGRNGEDHDCSSSGGNADL
jgi:uncharacterized membrane protein YgcG